MHASGAGHARSSAGRSTRSRDAASTTSRSWSASAPSSSRRGLSNAMARADPHAVQPVLRDHRQPRELLGRARAKWRSEFLLLNGDTLFEASVLERLLAAPEHPITLAVSRKDRYDDDDMKVIRDGDRLLQVGKKLPRERGERGIDRDDDVPRRRAAALPRCDRPRAAHAGGAVAVVPVADRRARAGPAWSSPRRFRRSGLDGSRQPGGSRARVDARRRLACRDRTTRRLSALDARRVSSRPRDDRPHELQVGHAVDVDRRLGERHRDDAGRDSRLPRYAGERAAARLSMPSA